MSLEMEPYSDTVPSIEDEAYEPQPQDYDQAFPALTSKPTEVATASQWNQKLSVKSRNVTQVFTVPLEERRFKEIHENRFGEETEQAKICKEIMTKTNVSIEMSMAKDQSLTAVIHGTEDAVMRARRDMVSRLQTQANATLKIPKEHHKFILGRNGKKLMDLELATSTKILIPRSDEYPEIKITGTKEGIERARHEIQCISDEQAKLAFERLNIPKAFHPFCCGPNNQIVKELMDETGARINVPPQSVHKDEITVSGEKEGVMKCKATLMAIFDEKRRKCQTVSVEVKKSQHKYVIGPRGSNIAEILAATGVSVEVPPLDSNSETITLRGEQDKLGPALTLVYSKANSVVFATVDAESWLHRFIIGRKGENVRKITELYPKVHIEFTDEKDKIEIEGPPEEVDAAVKALEEVVGDLKSRMDFAEIEINQKFHKHIIGKAGSNITRIKNETGVAIKIPSDADQSNTIRIEGEPTGVATAKKELLEMATRMENEKTKDIIIEHRFHKNIIGARGERIKEVRERFPQVQITFPDQGKKSDVVTLRGPKNDVDKCHKYLQQMHNEMIENSHEAHVKIFKDFHKNVIGKGGSTIRQIRDETGTRIDLPSESIDSDVITITGKKANVEAAKIKIEAIQRDLGNIKEITIEIPHKIHNSVIGAKGRLVRAIKDECGGVLIRFPPEGSSKDEVTIRGPKEDVENAKKQLLELTTEKQQVGFTAELRAKPEYHKFLIGRGGARIRKVRESTGARVIFPAEQDTEQDIISIIGRKEAVESAKAELDSLIKSLDNIEEGEMAVEPKHHRYFVARRGSILRHIADDFGGVTVSFPKSGVKSDRVVLKGPKGCVEGAKRRIQELVDNLDAQVTVECVIPQKYHRTVMGAKGSNVQGITREFDVTIKFPDKPIPNGAQADGEEAPMVNGDTSSEEGSKSPSKFDTIIIQGVKENCDGAKQALMDLVPITEEIPVPYDFHRFIIGQKGRDVRKMMQDFEVNITIPPADEKSDIVKVIGPPANIQRVKAALEEKVDLLNKEMEDKELRSFRVQIEVDPLYHPKIIGRRGQVITKIRDTYNVNIQFPDRGDENQSIITITGYEDKANAAKEAVNKIVNDLEQMVSLDVKVDQRVHPRIIGARGRTVIKIMDEFKVDIRFPKGEDIITITGDEDAVYECRDHLLNLEEEYLQDVIDQEYLKNLQKAPSRNPDSGGNRPKSKGFTVSNAPWDQAPDTSSTDEFPTFGATVAPKSSRAWGPFKKK